MRGVFEHTRNFRAIPKLKHRVCARKFLRVSKDEFPENIKKPIIGEIRDILTKINKKDLKLVTEIYFVSYHCKDDDHKDVKGRTLPIVYKTLIYPKAYDKLRIILTHEIGHMVFERGLSSDLKFLFTTELTKTFIQTAFWSQEEKNRFIRE